MIVYTTYSTDARVRREAETIASLAHFSVSVLVLKEMAEPRMYNLDGVEVVELNVPKYRGKSSFRYFVSYFIFLLLAFGKCTRLFMKNSLDLVHIHNMPNFLILAAIIPRLFGRKVILDMHDTLIETYASKFSGFSSMLFKAGLHLEEWICSGLASKVICVNHIQQQVLLNRGIPESKLVVLMNLPDPKKFRDRRGSRARSVKGGFRMVYFGTITKRLGIDLAIRAVGEIRDQIPGLQLCIFGNGEDRESFLKLSRQLGLDEIIHFSESSVPLDELIPAVRDMDLVVVPNRRNAATELMLPVKMLEGMALGIPVVVPRLKTIEFYFRNDQVFYFEPDDVRSLSSTMLNAAQSRTERDRKVERAKEFFEKYAWETQKIDLIGLYLGLARKGSELQRRLI
jgi:glycosyltransferase involved in cell wall biosynthesis